MRRATVGERAVPGRVGRALAVTLLLIVLPTATQAQRALDLVDSLAAAGQADAAREALLAWLDGDGNRASRPDRQRGLWLRAVLTIDPGQAAVDFRRLAVEYPGGPYSDRALLRLGQGALAAGNTDEARRQFGDLLRDYPQSPLRLEAREALARLPAAAGVEPPRGGAEPDDPPEPELPPPSAVIARERALAEAALAIPSSDSARRAAREQAAAPREQRAPVREQPAPPRAQPVPAREQPAPSREQPPPSPPAAVPANPSPPPAAAYAVQLGAFSTPARARQLAADLRARGLEPRLVLVPANALIRVRLGRFRDAADAEALLRFLAQSGLTPMVVEDVAEERPLP